MTARLSPGILAALERLEKISLSLQALDPQDHDALNHALAERRQAVADLEHALEGVVGCEEIFRRLEAALAAGRESMIRITLAREHTRSEISYVNQELHWLRALKQPGKGGMLDFSG